MMIPKILQFVWFGPPLPRWAKWMMGRWEALNPGWEVHLHGEEVLDDRYGDLYGRIEDKCSRSDLLRLSVLRQEGGIFWDSDFVPLLPLDPLLERYGVEDIFLTRQWPPGKPVGRKFVANGIFGITTDSPMWAAIDELVEETVVGSPDGLLPQGQLERTSFGPLLTTQLVRRNPRIPLSEVHDMYPWRPPRAKCIEKLAGVWRAGWAPEAIAATGAGGSTAAHLWAGGDYDIPELDELAKEPL